MLLGMENGGLSPLSADSHNLKVALEAAESIVCCCNGKVESSGTLPGIYSDIQSGAELYFSTPSADESKRCAYVVKAHEVSGDLKLPSPDGSFLNAKWIFEEVTERILLGICTARLLQLASVALLTGQYAHDFNNLIGAADGAVSLLQRNVGSDDKLVRRVSLIAESLSRSTALSQDLGLLVQKEDRNLQVMSASNLARFLEEGLSEQLLYSKVDCSGLNRNEKPGFLGLSEALSPYTFHGGDVVTRGLIFSLPNLVAENGLLSISVALETITDSSLKGVLPNLRKGNHLKLSFASSLSEVEQSLVDVRHLLIENAPSCVSPLPKTSVYQLLAYHGGAWRVDGEEPQIQSIEIFLPVSGA